MDKTKKENKTAVETQKEMLSIIEKICEKQIFELSPNDIGFLKARRSYLTAEQVEKFSEVLDETKENKKEKDEYKALVERAKELGLKTHKVTREDLKKAVAEAEEKASDKVSGQTE